MIVYKKDGAAISHYVVPEKCRARRHPCSSLRGRVAVVTWGRDGVEQAWSGRSERTNFCSC